MPYNLHKFPQAILHIDADCFFAACEVARHPELKGRAVVTGLERGIVSSLSYEAKALGVRRAMSFKEVKKICPDVVFLQQPVVAHPPDHHLPRYNQVKYFYDVHQ